MNNEDSQDQASPEIPLRVFARVQPSAGMQERILRRVQATQESARPQPAGPRKARTVRLVGLVAGCAAVVFGVHVSLHQPGRARSAVRPQSILAVRSTPPAAGPRGDADASDVRSPATPLVAQSTATVPPIAVRARRRAAGTTAWVSIPAPPAPLTEQEKVLLRLAQRRQVLVSQPNTPLTETDRSALPGEPLPAFPAGLTPGSKLPPFDVAAAPGHLLPPFPQDNLTGDPR